MDNGNSQTTPTPCDDRKRLKVAIIGGGPGGLGAALEFARLPSVDWKLYEKKSEISETGGGIALQPHTWRLLEHNGAAQNIKAGDMFRAVDGQREQRRNGRTGKLIDQQYNLEDVPANHQTCRLLRPKLQAALLKGVDQTRVHVNKKLVEITRVPNNQIRILFEDGSADVVDLLVGADGIRSVVRAWAFPGHEPRYRGQLVYRTVVRKSEVDKIPGMRQAWCPTFWKNVSGFYVFTCPLGNDDFEVTVRIRPPADDTKAEPVSWGRPFDPSIISDKFDDFCLPVREVLHLARGEEMREFALFAGPRLQRVIADGNVALIGDAAHPQSGNFGSGAGFALEDGYALARAVEWAWVTEGKSLHDALELFDSIRSPYYARLYDVLDNFAAVKAAIPMGLTVDQEIEERVKRISKNAERWMYYYEIEKEVDEAIRGADANSGPRYGTGR